MGELGQVVRATGVPGVPRMCARDRAVAAGVGRHQGICFRGSASLRRVLVVGCFIEAGPCMRRCSALPMQSGAWSRVPTGGVLDMLFWVTPFFPYYARSALCRTAHQEAAGLAGSPPGRRLRGLVGQAWAPHTARPRKPRRAAHPRSCWARASARAPRRCSPSAWARRVPRAQRPGTWEQYMPTAAGRGTGMSRGGMPVMGQGCRKHALRTLPAPALRAGRTTRPIFCLPGAVHLALRRR